LRIAVASIPNFMRKIMCRSTYPARVMPHPGLLGLLPALAAVLSGCTTDDVKIDENTFGDKFIAGVPVRNYGSTLQPMDWIIVFKNDATDQSLLDICQEKCDILAHRDRAFHGTEKDLEALLTGHAEEVEMIEPDLLIAPIPNMSETNKSTNQAPPSTVTRSANQVATRSANQAAASWGLDTVVGTSPRLTVGKGTHIYVLDTGIRTTHRDFGGRAIPTLDMTSGLGTLECKGSTSCAVDNNGHGTHCAGTAAGATYGVAPGATVHAVKVLRDSGAGKGSWVLGALDWIIRNGERPAVASMSLGSKGRSYTYKRYIDRATSAGIVVVVAAGNDNDNACDYNPAYVPSAITVGSTHWEDGRSSFSNYGSCVQIYAPGSSIISASYYSDTQSRTLSGTSMACPHVAGAAALLLQENPRKSPSQVRSELLSKAKSGLGGLTSDDPDKLLFVGGREEQIAGCSYHPNAYYYCQKTCKSMSKILVEDWCWTNTRCGDDASVCNVNLPCHNDKQESTCHGD